MTEKSAETKTADGISPSCIEQFTLSDHDEILFRQVHPTLFDEGEPTSSAFMPNPSDDGQVSVDRSTMTTAKESFELFLSNGRLSGGTYGVTVGEFGAQELKCYADPIQASEGCKANPAHSRVDYNALGTNKRKTVAKRLKKCALDRGVLHKA